MIRRPPTEPSAVRRYTGLLLIPLRLDSLVTLVVLSAALTAALLTAPFGLPLFFLLLGWLLKYSFAFLDQLVIGKKKAPLLSIEMILASLGETRLIVPLILVIVMFFASGAGAYLYGLLVATSMAMVAIVCLPAVLAVQGWTGSALRSLSFSVCRTMVRSLGNDYLWVVGSTAAVLAVCLLGPSIAGGTPLMFRILLWLYAWLAVIAVIGGALHANRGTLEREIPLIAPQLRSMSEQELTALRERWADSIYAAWRGNALDNAWRFVSGRLAESADPLAELQWLYERVARWTPPQFSDRVARELLTNLLRQHREGEVLRLVGERLSRDATFRPSTDAETQHIAKLAHDCGERKTAETLGGSPTRTAHS